MKRVNRKMTMIERVFRNSRVNGAEYRGDQLKVNAWKWPEGYATKRLREKRGGK
jgi:hypothetical protein